jgi:uncharacterized protein DUF2513
MVYIADIDNMRERPTWTGHEFFDGIRSETLWNKIKAAGQRAGGPAFVRSDQNPGIGSAEEPDVS